MRVRLTSVNRRRSQVLVADAKRGNDEQERETLEDVGNEAGKWKTLASRAGGRGGRGEKKVAKARDVWSVRVGMGMSRGNAESPRRVEKSRTRM